MLRPGRWSRCRARSRNPRDRIRPGALNAPLTADPSGDPLRGIPPPLRHPSQLYEAFGEGLLLWAILWSLKNRSFFKGRMFAFYVFGYGLIRFLVEYTREPDAQLGFVLGSLSMGQVLCSVMIFAGIILMFFPAREVPVRG